MRVNVQQIQHMLGHAVQSAVHMPEQEVTITSVCRDTNDVAPGALFVCIQGARVDGHDFAAQAVEAGAVALLVTRPLPHVAVPQWVVKDTVQALGALAHAWRKSFTGLVIAVTGSAGKTTVKEVLADILAASGKKVARNILNYNNQVGMPLSVLATSGQEDVWVMEVGISEAHDMDVLGAILQPHVALVINAGNAHAAGLGEKGVAYHKSRLFAHVVEHASLAGGAKAFASADYADLRQEAQAVWPQVIYFSANNAPEALYAATYLGRTQGKGKYALRKQLDASGGAQRFEILAPFYGSYGAENVAAIVAVAEAVGLDVLQIQHGFKQAQLPQQRFDVQQVGPWHIVDDSYNANPLSMKCMLMSAVEMAKAEGLPCYAVLGAMAELGEIAEQEHVRLGTLLAQSGIKDIFWAGDYGQAVLQGLQAENYDGIFIQVKNVANFTHHWEKRHLKPGLVFCKGSRSNKLEELVTIIHIFAQKNAQNTIGKSHAV